MAGRPINPLRIGNMLAEAYNATRQPIQERASILPLGTYEDGSVHPAWPGLLAAPFEGLANFGRYGYGDDAVEDNARHAFDIAGGAATGGLAAGALRRGGTGSGALTKEIPSETALSSDHIPITQRRGTLPELRLTKPQFGGTGDRQTVSMSILNGKKHIGAMTGRVSGNEFKIDGIETFDGSNSLGLGGARHLREQLRDYFPDVTKFTGDRVVNQKTGAAATGAVNASYKNRKQDVDYFANPPTAASVPLATQSQDGGGSDDYILADILRRYGMN